MVAEITVAPMGRTVLLGTPRVEFYCVTIQSTHFWKINGSRLDRTLSSLHEQRGITRCQERHLGGSEFESRLCVHASKDNNNTSIQCVAFNTQSVPVTLKIQGTTMQGKRAESPTHANF